MSVTDVSGVYANQYKEVVLSQGAVRYRERGEGPVLVFVHGLLVNGMLWNGVVEALSGSFRCIVPDLPLGAHAVALEAEADLTPPGVALLVADFLEALDLKEVTLVGNDTGGAICQIVVAYHPERIVRLVLTNCDAFEEFFPVLIRPFQDGARVFGIGFANFLAELFRFRGAQKLLMRTVSLRPAKTEEVASFFKPLQENAGIRRDLTKFLRGVDRRHTLAAADNFAAFQKPVMIIWGKNDRFFSAKLARRLQKAFPRATLEYIGQAKAFVPVDQPEFLARRITEFVNEFIQS